MADATALFAVGSAVNGVGETGGETGGETAGATADGS
jgi:hypothetical protein